MRKQVNLPAYETREIDTPDFKGVILDSNNYEDKISQIEIFHAGSKEKDDFLTEEEQSIMRSELGKLMWLARIARPDAIYDASAAAQNFANWQPDVSKDEISEDEIQEGPIKVDVPKPNDSEHTPGFKDFLFENSKEVNEVNLFKKPKKADTSKTHFAVENLLPLKKAIRKLKGG